jgi:hypothetical protein
MEESESPVGGLAGRFRSFAPKFYGHKRVLLRGVFLRENNGWINKSRRSLLRGLGINVTASDLKESGLWARELRYLALPSEKALPPTFSCWSQVPEGFEIGWREFDRQKIRVQDLALKSALLEAAWKPARVVTMKQYNETWFDGIDLSEKVCSSTSSRFDRLARLTNTSHAFVRSRLRWSALCWAFSCIDSYSSWIEVKKSGRISLDALWMRRVGSRIKMQTYYRPVARPVMYRNSKNSYIVNAICKFADSPPNDETSGDNIIDEEDGWVYGYGKAFPPPDAY